ncbi:MAG: hypothetical protein SFZ24_00770 [Planctomycetota bacterium]|nr:hypothetical protein [Planctomycetota bacterium]
MTMRVLAAVGAFVVGLAGAGSASGGVQPPCDLNIDLMSFSDDGSFFLNGSAEITGGQLRLTTGISGQAGSAWFVPTRVDPAAGFDTTFVFTINNGTADGLAFVLQSEGVGAIGGSGSDLGYAGILRSLAIEIDTFAFDGEFSAPHISVQSRGQDANSAADVDTLAYVQLSEPLVEQQQYQMRVVYSGGLLYVFFAGSTAAQIIVPVDFSNIAGGSVLDPGGCLIAGFTGATGGVVATQSILQWTFSNSASDPKIGCGARFITDATESPALFSLVGTATADAGDIILTRGVEGEAGASWYRVATADVQQGFDTSFTFELEGQADGIAFLIQSDSVNALSGGGSDLGYGAGVAPGIARSLAVEIDTFCFPDEFACDHVSIQTDGVNQNQSGDFYSLAHADAPIDLNDGEPHTLRVAYTPGVMEVYLDGSLLLTHPIDLASIAGQSILNKDGCAFIGFTGSTGAAFAQQRITSWTFTDSGACVPPLVTGFTAGDVVAPGPLEFSVTATGTLLTYQWFRDGNPLANGGNISGATSPQLRIDPVNGNWSGQYDVAVSNACGGSSTGAFFSVTPRCPGDANDDLAVNFADITEVLRRFGTSYDDGTGPGDPNIDGQSSFSDVTEVLRYFGSSCR